MPLPLALFFFDTISASGLSSSSDISPDLLRLVTSDFFVAILARGASSSDSSAGFFDAGLAFFDAAFGAGPAGGRASPRRRRRSPPPPLPRRWSCPSAQVRRPCPRRHRHRRCIKTMLMHLLGIHLNCIFIYYGNRFQSSDPMPSALKIRPMIAFHPQQGFLSHRQLPEINS